MKKLLLFPLSLFVLACGSAQQAKQNDYSRANVNKYMNTITAADLKKHLYIVASDEMEGRDTGTPGQKKAGKYLISQYEANDISFPTGADSFYQTVPSEFMARPFSPKLNDSENIWAFIKGTEKPDEILVISAHYDHVGMKNGQVYNGADDDGSGTVALLEIAQAFMAAKKDGYAPKRSILFLHVTGEEHGLHGSRYYSENPLFPIENTIADLNIDMIGRRDNEHTANGNYVYIIGSDRLSTDLHTINETANKKYTNLELDYTYNDRNDPNQFYFRSDHYNFAKKGIPIIFYFNGVHADYHKPTDTPDKIEYDILAKRAQLAFVTAWELANRENRPVVDKDGK
ncbi:M28 family peptidase [Flavobacterium salilacus subsp. salilacus]|uniref:M28 family metallopeptidase n=1 Tax=Flavobacterium TaxID=237 RepID=UPI001074DB9E|nr:MULTISPECIES: M28 family metallopeptidase [Flavobacterium]KAF2519291.1 M28 family peptidase [Flavobacterium salilacus subsp. salilacus]MBE1613480.1 M28 family peptidase [Flavobacterium sp. SaA2.13]